MPNNLFVFVYEVKTFLLSRKDKNQKSLWKFHLKSQGFFPWKFFCRIFFAKNYFTWVNHLSKKWGEIKKSRWRLWRHGRLILIMQDMSLSRSGNSKRFLTFAKKTIVIRGWWWCWSSIYAYLTIKGNKNTHKHILRTLIIFHPSLQINFNFTKKKNLSGFIDCGKVFSILTTCSIHACQ